MAKTKKQRDSVVFYRSFYESIKELEPEQQAEVYSAIFEFGLNGVEPKISGIAKSIFTLIKPQIVANNARYFNGQKGGRPRKDDEENTEIEDENIDENEPKQNQSEIKHKPKQNLDLTKAKPKVIQSETKHKPNENEKENVNVNEKENIPPQELIGNNPSACARGKEGYPTLEEVESFAAFRNSPVDAKKFYETYANATPSWTDKSGLPIQDWRKVFVAWEKQYRTVYTDDGTKTETKLGSVSKIVL